MSAERMGRALAVALLAATVMGGQCDPQGPPFFGIVSVAGTGDIVGEVTVDGAARAGVAVILREDATTIETFVSEADGHYEFLNLEPGDYSLSTTIEGATCNPVPVTVVADQTTEADLPCTTPTTGTVSGRVTVNGAGEVGVMVVLRQGVTTLATTTTDVDGNYQFAGVSPGPRIVQIQPPSNVTCPQTQRNVQVAAGGVTTVDFACSRSSEDFSVTMSTPPPGWVHDQPGVSALECKVIRTSPAQPGASFSAVTNGPAEGGPSGVISPQPVTGTLNENGQAELRVRIDRDGTYINIVTVTSGSFQRTASATVTVTSADNTCPEVDD
jgi:hypothetical protein